MPEPVATAKEIRRMVRYRQFASRKADERMNVASQSNAPVGEHDADHAQAFKLRGGSFTLLILQLVDLKNPNFFQWLLD